MSLFVVFVAPFFSNNAVQTIRGFIDLEGVRLAIISQDSLATLPSEIVQRVVAHWQVQNGLDSGQIRWAAEGLTKQNGRIHRLLGAMEQIQVQLAEVREALGIPGMSVQTALNFRDKARMKQVLREAGLPCANYRRVLQPQDAWGFVAEVGYPAVLKPLAGAGSQATYRVETEADLAAALTAVSPTPTTEAVIEEFIVGEEHSFEVMSLSGQRLWHSLTRYQPTPLDAMRNPWIQWCAVLPQEARESQYDDVKAAGFAALDALGMETGLSHMEWFRRKDGSVAISEVAARPPGAQITTLINRANDIDILTDWAKLMVLEQFEPPIQQFASGVAFLRGQAQGWVKQVRGLQEANSEMGHLMVDVKLPQVGQPTSISYEGEGFVVVRHEETAVVEQALKRLITLIQVESGT